MAKFTIEGDTDSYPNLWILGMPSELSLEDNIRLARGLTSLGTELMYGIREKADGPAAIDRVTSDYTTT